LLTTILSRALLDPVFIRPKPGLPRPKSGTVLSFAKKRAGEAGTGRRRLSEMLKKNLFASSKF
jgi:hypothetical protein